jgi:chaperone required for assembly of F1-ATPase
MTDGKSPITIPPIKDKLARPLPKRFYTAAEVAERDGLHVLLLDGRTVKTPGKALLAVPSQPLAAVLAAEWAAQVDVIDPTTMPLTRLVNTAIDGVTQHAAQVAADIVKYAGSDLLCYRAEHPETLVARQAAAWDPVLAWAAEALGARFAVGRGIVHVAQNDEALARIETVVAPLPPLRLTGLHVMMTLTGSALLALAVEKGHLDAASAWAAAHVDEDWQASQWGDDDEAMTRRALRWRDMEAAAKLVALV